MKLVARTKYSRNMWAILTKFNVLPTNEDFQSLSNEQIDWIIASMNEDVREANAIARGYSIENTYTDGGDYDNDVWENDNWDIVQEGVSEESIIKQTEALINDPLHYQEIELKLQKALQAKKLAEKQADVQLEENKKALEDRLELIKKQNNEQSKEKVDMSAFEDDDDFAEI